MRLESLAQVTDVGIFRQMAEGLSGLVPTILLWVQVRASGREGEQVQERMGFDTLFPQPQLSLFTFTELILSFSHPPILFHTHPLIHELAKAR